jgi:hypothetical protein
MTIIDVMCAAGEISKEMADENEFTVSENQWGGYDSVSGTARITDDDDDIQIFAFHPRGGVLWSTRFSPSVPVEVVLAAWRSALA